MANPDLEFYRNFARTPAGQGFLRSIRAGEGTAGPKGYQTLFGGGLFTDFRRHPDQVVNSGGYSSAAAGAYQIMPDTWQGVAKKLGLPDFSPQSQDIAAAYLGRQRLLPLGGLSILEKEGLSPRVAAALAPEWASFPTMAGNSYYNQPVKKLGILQTAFNQGKAQAPQTSRPQTPRPQTEQPRLAGKNAGILSLMQQILPNNMQIMPNIFGVGTPTSGLQNLFNKFGPLQ